MESASKSVPAASSVQPFLSKTYDMVEDSSTNDVVSWSVGNNSFVVWNVPELAKDLLPKYFKHNNFSSFVRQLNTYGFRKVDPDRWEFANEGFLRGQKHMLKSIVRRKPSPLHNQQQTQLQNSSTGACVEVGKFGLEEDVERLNRDKNILMQELIRLRRQQQATDNQLQTVGHRVQVMEQRQQQMVSFLARAMQNPGFLNQLVQQQNDSKRRIGGSNKKRRLSREDQENSNGGLRATDPNGQIVKYEPSMTESAESMLRQILKRSTSPRLEPHMNNFDSFLLDNIPSDVPENGSPPDRVSEVTFSQVAPISGLSCISGESGFPVSCKSSETHCGPHMVLGSAKTDQMPETNMFQAREDTDLLNLAPMQVTELRNCNGDFMRTEAGDGVYMDLISDVLDGNMVLNNNDLSPDGDLCGLLDGTPKLPGINDAFWEQFFPGTGDIDEICSNSTEAGLAKEPESLLNQKNGWDKTQHMGHLAGQMGPFASEAQRK